MVRFAPRSVVVLSMAIGACVLGSAALGNSATRVQVKSATTGKLRTVTVGQITSCRVTSAKENISGWGSPPVQVKIGGATYFTSRTNLAAILKVKKCSTGSASAPKKVVAKKAPAPAPKKVSVPPPKPQPKPAPELAPKKVDHHSTDVPSTSQGQVILPHAAIAPDPSVAPAPQARQSSVSENTTARAPAAVDEIASVNSPWGTEPEVYGEFTVQTYPKLNPYDRVPLPEHVRLRLVEPSEPSAKHSWYFVKIDGIDNVHMPLFIDSHSLNLMASTRQADGSYDFNPAQLPVRPRTIDVQFINDKGEAQDIPVEMNDLAYVDPMSKNVWGGVLAVTKNGRRGYTADVNLPKLEGIPLQRAPSQQTREAVVREEDVQEAESGATTANLRSSHSHRVVISNNKEFPYNVEMRMLEKKSVSFKGGKDPGFGHIDPAISHLLKVNSKWSVKPACEKYDQELCRAFSVNGEGKPSRDRFLLVKAIMYHESHLDPNSFRVEKRFIVGESPGWIAKGWAKYKKESPYYESNPKDEMHARQFHSSFGLMHIFIPAVAEWYPIDTDWNAKPGGAADVREIVNTPARLLDPTTNLIWGIRILKTNYARAKNILAKGNSSMSELQVMAAAYNGGAGALTKKPPGVTGVDCRPGIDSDCKIEGARKVPYHLAIDNIVKEMKQSCNVASNPCGGN